MRMQHVNVKKRQANSGGTIAGTTTIAVPTVESFSALVTTQVTGTSLPTSFSLPTVTLVSTEPTFNPTPTATPSADAAGASSSSQISVGTVVGACVGAFAGAAVLIGLLIFYCRRDAKERRALATAAITRGQVGRGGQWQKADEDTWEGKPGASVARRDTMMTEKAFGMFKKSPSIYSSKTGSHAHSSEEAGSGFALPPLEFSKYHPGLAAELAQPPRPFAERGESGVSWDGSTVADDSFLSMRSVRVDTGTMSPTITVAKATPPATASAIHRWESAEVLQIEHDDAAGPEEVNPFADSPSRRSVANPFFNARDMSAMSRSRSRSLSRSTSRATSRVRSMSDAPNRASTIRESAIDPFVDVQEIPLTRPMHALLGREQHDSVASGYSAAAFGEHAMRSLIAALDLTEDQVQDRLRAAASPSVRTSSVSAYSAMTGLTTTSVAEGDIATVRDFPMPPASPQSSGSGHSAL